MILQDSNPIDEVPESAAPESAPDTAPEAAEETAAEAIVEESAQPQAVAEPPIIADVSASEEDDEIPSASESADEDDNEDVGGESATPRLKRGMLLEGTIKETSPTQVVVDLGEGMAGVVPARELSYLDSKILEGFAVDAPLLVFIKAFSSDGQPVLSVSRALEEQDWLVAEEYANNKKVYEARVAGYNKGGLIVRFGRLRGFIPASQISAEREHRAGGNNPDARWGGMLNEKIHVKVVEVNRSRNRLILSERAAIREVREEQKERLISELKVKDIRKGRVISLTDFGAFVNLGGADGLIHLTEITWKHINHPNEVLSVGDEVEVEVINIDPDRKRIGLSMRSLEQDPWKEVVKQYGENQLVQGKITKLTRFGAFASLVDNEEIEGLIHVSELADYRVDHPRDVVAVGDVLTLRVIKIDNERRRLGLSLRRVNSPEFLDSDWQSWNP